MSDVGYRPLGLETDVANPNFAGAMNPDELLHKEFYWHDGVDRNKTDKASEEAGRFVRVKAEPEIYVRIMARGDKNTIIERKKVLNDEIRFPKEWRMFQIQEGMIEANENVPGWKIEEWDLSEDEIRHLKFLRFYTVEQIASASDAQIANLGMGGLGLRKRAVDACRARSTQAVRSELDEKDKKLNELAEQVAKLTALLTNPAPQATEPTPNPQPEGQPAVAVPKKKYVMTQAHKDAMKAAREAKKAAKGT